MTRRELLQYFGIGTTITPVLGGVPIVRAAATLLAVPSLEAAGGPFPQGNQPSHFHDRLKWNPYEAIWLKFWQIENCPPPYLNSGVGALEHILKREPTPEEKAAVAGVLQWFGTNCGHFFIEETLRACGYSVDYLPSTESKEIQSLQHANIWNGDGHREVTVKRHGMNIILRSNGEPEVSQ